MIFWGWVALLLLLALLWVGYALLRIAPDATNYQESRVARNVALYRTRLAASEGDLAEEMVTPEEHAALANELARQLLADVDSLGRSPQGSATRRKWFWLFLPVPLLALPLYQLLGAWPDWQITRHLQAMADSTSVEEYRQQITELQPMLDSRIRQKPEHIGYRQLLGELALERRDYAAAAIHYGILVELLPEDDEALALFAEAEYLANGKQMTPRLVAAMEKALALNPHQLTVLGIQGVHALENNNLLEAITIWQKMVEILPADSEQSLLLQQAIARAREELGGGF